MSYNFAFGSNSLSFIFLNIFAFLLFWPYLRIHWTDFAHLKDNIVGNKISYNIGHHHFFCICHISQFDHFFANISGSNEPILLILELSLTN